LSREGNSQKWRMKDNKSHFWRVTFTWGLRVKGCDRNNFQVPANLFYERGKVDCWHLGGSYFLSPGF